MAGGDDRHTALRRGHCSFGVGGAFSLLLHDRQLAGLRSGLRTLCAAPELFRR